jgi:hypothetical protein
MSLKRDNIPNPQEFINLKAEVKAEMLKRNGYGDLSTYGSSTYDYTIQPSKDAIPRLEHYSKIRDVITQINPSRVGQGEKKTDEITPEMVILEANVASFKAQPRSATSNNDCASMCSGVCVSQCTTTCSGSCGTSCDSNGCTNTCSADGCTGCSSCSGSCTDTCAQNGCTNCTGCSGTCSNACAQNGCTNCTGCSGTCTNTCSQDGCTNCSGCSGQCGGNCTGTCVGGQGGIE